MQNIVTSIDLGSNSFRVLKFDCTQNKPLCEFSKTVGTADGLLKSGDISKEALQRILVAIEESIEIVQYDPQVAVAVTTQALRSANNAQEILQTIQQKTGISFTIIDGKKEGQLTLLSMQNALKREKLADDDFVLLDIGGGSTELIIYQKKKSTIKSFPFGIVTLSQSINTEKDLNHFQKEIKFFLENSKKDLINSIFVSTAGTPTIIAALKHGLDNDEYDKHIINGTTLTLDEVYQIQNKLNSIGKEELIKKVGSGREEFINTGMLIYSLFFKALQKEYSIVFDDGLREGVALDACRVEYI